MAKNIMTDCLLGLLLIVAIALALHGTGTDVFFPEVEESDELQIINKDTKYINEQN